MTNQEARGGGFRVTAQVPADGGAAAGGLANHLQLAQELIGEEALAELNAAGYAVLPTDHVLSISKQLTEARAALSQARAEGAEDARRTCGCMECESRSIDEGLRS